MSPQGYVARILCGLLNWNSGRLDELVYALRSVLATRLSNAEQALEFRRLLDSSTSPPVATTSRAKDDGEDPAAAAATAASLSRLQQHFSLMLLEVSSPTHAEAQAAKLVSAHSAITSQPAWNHIQVYGRSWWVRMVALQMAGAESSDVAGVQSSSADPRARQ